MKNQLHQDPFVAMLICAKAESREADLTRLLTDDEYLITARDEFLKKVYMPETGEELGSLDGWKFLILLADENWRARNPIVCDIVDMPFQYGALVTSDYCFKPFFNQDALLEFQTTMRRATATLKQLRANGVI